VQPLQSRRSLRTVLVVLVVAGPVAVQLLRPGAAPAGAEGAETTAGRGVTGPAALPPIRPAPPVVPAHVPRLAWQPVADSTIARVGDFTLLGDTLVVLDPRTHQVVLLRAHDGAWRQVASFGRRGGGPGELQRPAAIAAVGDTALAVLELGGRTQRFLPDGRLRGAERAELPCPMFAPELAYGDDGVRYLAGNCAGGARGADTVYAVLHAARGDGDYRLLVRLPRMAMDLSWGSAMATFHPLAEHRDSIRFALGLDTCAYALPRGGAAAPPPPACGLAAERLSAPPPAELERQRELARSRGDARRARMLRWPEALPVHFGILPRADGLHLLRPVSGDSLVVVPAGAPFDAAGASLAAPIGTLVGCRRGACLWFDADGARLALVR
jgi:hypothetical protein